MKISQIKKILNRNNFKLNKKFKMNKNKKLNKIYRMNWKITQKQNNKQI